MILGLTGSYGSGKSTVAGMLRELGAEIIDADEIAREVVRPGQPALGEIREAFGEEVIRPDGALDRPALSRLVFSSPEKRRLLESIVHPRIRERELSLLERLKDRPLVVLNVPLLFETGLDSHCDTTLVVTLDESEREKRLAQRDQITPEQIRRRLDAQMPQDEKARRADLLVDNSHSLDHTRQQVERIARQLLRK